VHVALAEHASIASFASHLLELMAIGAPPELLAEVSQAQLDEVMHTQMALERARELGAEVIIGPLDTSCQPRTSLVDIALGVANEGCVNETLAVLEAEASLPFEDAKGRALLESIARDETRHAALAWRTLQWMWPRLTSGERRRVRAALMARWPERWRHALAHVIPACVQALDAEDPVQAA
jgi:demethoxyubiquinone hydroxylase (CLK1/Coq7/Cat5 family)